MESETQYWEQRDCYRIGYERRGEALARLMRALQRFQRDVVGEEGQG